MSRRSDHRTILRMSLGACKGTPFGFSFEGTLTAPPSNLSSQPLAAHASDSAPWNATNIFHGTPSLSAGRGSSMTSFVAAYPAGLSGRSKKFMHHSADAGPARPPPLSPTRRAGKHASRNLRTATPMPFLRKNFGFAALSKIKTSTTGDGGGVHIDQ